jgi:hypothetical protein
MLLDCALDDLLREKLSKMTRNPDFLNTLSEDQKANISARLHRAITMPRSSFARHIHPGSAGNWPQKGCYQEVGRIRSSHPEDLHELTMGLYTGPSWTPFLTGLSMI